MAATENSGIIFIDKLPAFAHGCPTSVASKVAADLTLIPLF
jgi:hypothetical protein